MRLQDTDEKKRKAEANDRFKEYREARQEEKRAATLVELAQTHKELTKLLAVRLLHATHCAHMRDERNAIGHSPKRYSSALKFTILVERSDRRGPRGCAPAKAYQSA